MSRTSGLVGLAAALFVIVHLGCGGGNSASPASSTGATPTRDPHAEVATGSTLTEFQKRRLLGHYSTQDGATGFILDRTVTPWRGKLDGTNKVVTLNESNEPRRGVKEYTSEDHSIWVRVDTESGEVELFQGPKQHEGVRVHRDADAQQLK
jgi:hypothetical protein